MTDSPFRMLDEFDVFVDMMNGRLSMGMMLELATTQAVGVPVPTRYGYGDQS